MLIPNPQKKFHSHLSVSLKSPETTPKFFHHGFYHSHQRHDEEYARISGKRNFEEFHGLYVMKFTEENGIVLKQS
ncbi:hypothetical protein Leryth_024205 [Lithospermum erythrorhizon]|nr:hypothetical protein Leryth_024205 [Lithospermum erythrorhizon]